MTSLLPPTWHPALVAALVASAVAFVVAARRTPGGVPISSTWRFAGSLVVLYLACGWPLGDLAAHVSLTALVIQRLLLMLVAAPLVLASLPVGVVRRATHPPIVDGTLCRLGQPAVAIGVVTVIGTVTLLPIVVTWASSGSMEGTIVVLVTFLVGVVLWLPLLGIAPGTRRLSNVGKGGYCMAASLVVTSLSFVWIFSTHVLYPSFTHQHSIVAMSPIVDQQLAGYVSKLGAYLPLWITAFVYFAKSGDGGEDDPTLRWVDVERELERSDRKSQRQERSATS